MIDIKVALEELQTKSYFEIQISTAYKWASRACAAYQIGDPYAGEYEAEALEHASQSGPDGYLLVKEIYNAIKPYKNIDNV